MTMGVMWCDDVTNISCNLCGVVTCYVLRVTCFSQELNSFRKKHVSQGLNIKNITLVDIL